MKKYFRLLSALCLMTAGMAFGADYYWTGAAGKVGSEKFPLLNTPGNWRLENGEVPLVQPSHDDVLIFTNSPGTLHFYGTNRNDQLPAFKAFVLKGQANNVTLYAETNSVCPSYSYWAPYVISNETESGTLTIGNRDVKMGAGRSGTQIVTNLFYVGNANAFIKNTHHMQNADNDYTVVLKRGAGTLVPFGGHNYYTRNYTLEGGTISFPGHKQRHWVYCTLVFSGDDPNCTYVFNHETYKSDYGGVPAAAWAEYAFERGPREDGVFNTEHALTSPNGAYVAYTGTVDNVRFTGRLRGKLNLRWCPANTEKRFTCAKGRSDTTGTLEVNRGTFALTEGAVFSSLGNLIVDSGATLDLAAGSVLMTKAATLNGTALDEGVYAASEIAGCAGDGLLVVGTVSGFKVPYVAATKTVTPLDFTESAGMTRANLTAMGGVSVALSEAINITNGTLHETNRFAVATFAATADATADLFVDASPKKCDLPVTWFETETVGDVTTLYLVARPVVSSRVVDDVRQYYYIMDQADVWSDGLVPHAGADYYCNIPTKNGKSVPDGGHYVHDRQNASTRANPLVFPGETLTIDRCRFNPYSREFTANLRFYNCNSGNDDMFLPYSAGTTVLRGTVFVGSGCVADWGFRSNDGKDGLFQLEATVVSTNGMSFRNTWSKTRTNQFYVVSDNSQVTGPTILLGNMSSNNGWWWNEVLVTITNKTALGGPIERAGTAGVRFQGFPKLTIAESMVYDVTNRNWFAVSHGLRLEVNEGKTLSLMLPLYSSYADTSTYPYDDYILGRGGLVKSGRGVFAFGSTLITCWSNMTAASPNGTNNAIRVMEGGVKPLVANAFDNVQFSFADGTSLVVDPTLKATAESGVRVLNCVPAFADGAVVDLVPEVAPTESASFRMAFLTVPAATPDLSAVLRVKKIETDQVKMAGTLVKESVTVNGVSCTRYSVDYRTGGMCIIFR